MSADGWLGRMPWLRCRRLLLGGIMPKAMKQWCKAAGCSGEAVERGYCKACAGKRPQSGDAYRGSRHERGYGSRWEKLRMSVLRLSPGCVVWAACH